MKDEIYVFYEDVKEKSITARGAHSRPSRRKLRAPNYTKKELQKMNGQVNSINLNAVMPYAYFKTLPESLKKKKRIHTESYKQVRRRTDRNCARAWYGS